MATAPDPDEVLCSTREKENFQRVTRLLISGGTTLLREILDQLCPPSNFPTILKNPATEKLLRSAKLTKPQWDCLYPSPGVYGKSKDFDVTLLFKLLRTISNLIPPATGWDALPTNTDHSLAADLARIKYYRNTVYGHVNQQMEITDDFQFLSLWQEINGALVRIAGQISLAKKGEWQGSIDKFLKDPLTAEDERNVQELLEWYRSDMEVKQSIEELKTSSQKGLEHLEGVLEGTAHAIEKKGQVLENTVREEAQDIKDQLGGGLKTTAQEVQCLEKAVREESKDIKGQLEKVQKSMDKLRPGYLRLWIDGKAISRPALQGGSSLLPLASPENDAGIHEAALLPGPSPQSEAEPRGDVGTVSIKTDPAPTVQEVLNLAAHKYLQTIDPSKPEDMNAFVYYLERLRKVLIVDNHSGSLIITVECRSREILDGLWDDYCTGYLNEMAQKFLLTEELLKELGLTEVKLTTTIPQEDYRTCLEYFQSTDDDIYSYIPGEKKIVVKTRSANTAITLYVTLEDTIQSVKRKITDEVKIPVDQQRLTFLGDILEDDRSLNDYNIQRGSMLWLDVLAADSVPQIFVKTHSGKTMITINIEPEHTVQALKREIRDETGIPTNQQHITFDFNELEDGLTLDSYGIRQGSILYMRPYRDAKKCAVS